MIDRPGSHSPVEAVLAGCVYDPHYFAIVRNDLLASDLLQPDHRLIYNACREAERAKSEYEFWDVEQALRASGLLTRDRNAVSRLAGKEGLLIHALADVATVKNMTRAARLEAVLAQGQGLISKVDLRAPGAFDGLCAELQERIGSTEGVRGHSDARMRLLTVDEVLASDSQEFVLQGVLPVGGLGVVYGKSGTGKTFLAIDMGLAIATGGEWNGRSTKHGAVTYIAGEGEGGLGKRLRAAFTDSDRMPAKDKFRVLGGPLKLLDKAQCREFSTRVRQDLEAPALIIVDTLSRCFSGKDENNAGDMSSLVEACSLLTRETGAAVLLIHHTTKTGETERGSSALRGAADLMLEVKGTSESGLKLRFDKVKDEEAPEPVNFALEPVVTGDADGQKQTSCVVRFGGKSQAQLGPKDRALLGLIRDKQGGRDGPVPITAADASCSKQTLSRRLRGLQDRGYINREVRGNSKLCSLTAKGGEAVEG